MINSKGVYTFMQPDSQRHSKRLESVKRMSLDFICRGPPHMAMPGSTQSFLIQSDSHLRLQSQFRGLPPRALQYTHHPRSAETVFSINVHFGWVIENVYYNQQRMNDRLVTKIKQTGRRGGGV